MQFRSDLATEILEAGEADLTDHDFSKQTVRNDDIVISTIHIHTPRAERVLGKPMGRYITVDIPPLSDNAMDLEDMACRLAEPLRDFLPKEGTVVVAGLGNDRITPDALGPSAASMVLATRHIGGEFARSAGLEDLRPTAVLAPGVLGQTGIESSEIIRGVCSRVDPTAVIVIDALACRSLSRLGCTLQVCDTGIAPGSGVGNHRAPLNADTLGVPVLAIGVPTVVDAATVAMELCGSRDGEGLLPDTNMMVTPREIDLIIDRAARLVAMTVNRLLQPNYSPLELVSLAV